MRISKLLILITLLSGCSLFGIQTEETPKYKVLIKEENFEIREYSPYIVARTTVKGKYNKSSSKAFRILAGYIFGKNQSKKQISMTSPVEMQTEKIAMTSPVEIEQSSEYMTMSFSMPSQYKLEDLPTPNDKRIEFDTVQGKVVASVRFTGLRDSKKIKKQEKNLRSWLKKYKKYSPEANYSYAGYNPPWTIPFFRRNEVHIKLNPL